MNSLDIKQRDWHTKWYQDILNSGPKEYEGNMDPNDFGFWTQIYCLEDIKNFFLNIPKSTFLTVGDGYCGREGMCIQSYGHKVHASDWEPCLIKLAKERGLIDNWSKQDLYDLDFHDETFDFVICKETLHHLSMPYKGLYEMLRVAKKGAIILEPSGEKVPKLKNNDFEPTGNYVFTFTPSELIHIGLAYGYRKFMYSYTTVFYPPFKGNDRKEKERLIIEDFHKKPEDRNTLVFFFIKDDFIFNISFDKRFNKISVNGTGRNW